MHLRERSDRTSHAAYPAARRTTNLAVLIKFYVYSLNRRKTVSFVTPIMVNFL